MFDPASLVVTIFAAWKEAKRAHQWGRLLFGMLFSGTIGFLGTAGGSLAAGTEPWIAIGHGMMAAATVLLGLFVASPLTRKMSISVPKEVVEKLHKGNLTGIHKG